MAVLTLILSVFVVTCAFWLLLSSRSSNEDLFHDVVDFNSQASRIRIQRPHAKSLAVAERPHPSFRLTYDGFPLDLKDPPAFSGLHVLKSFPEQHRLTYVAITESCQSFDGTNAQAPPKLWSYLLNKSDSSKPEFSTHLIQVCAALSDNGPVVASLGVCHGGDCVATVCVVHSYTMLRKTSGVQATSIE